MKRFRYLFPAFRCILFALVMLFVPTMVQAQVSVKMKVVQNNFLQYENIFVRVAIRNLSAHPLAFGEANSLNGKLRFEIVPADTSDPKVMPLVKGVKGPELTGLILAPGANQTFLFNLTAHYDVRREGKYMVRAVVSHPQLEHLYQSNEEFFNVVRGTRIWSRTVGIPLLDEAAADMDIKAMEEAEKNKKAENDEDGQETAKKTIRKIGTRTYTILRYFTGTTNVYCLQLEDKNNVYLLRHIGFDLGADLKPKCEVDFLSRLNILLPASPKVFAYYQYNSDGKLEKKSILMKTDTEPTFAVDVKSGIITVVGGREARKDVDYEEIRDLPFLEDMSDTDYFPAKNYDKNGEEADDVYKKIGKTLIEDKEKKGVFDDILPDMPSDKKSTDAGAASSLLTSPATSGSSTKASSTIKASSTTKASTPAKTPNDEIKIGKGMFDEY